MDIFPVSGLYEQELKSFLAEIKAIKEINDELIRNASVIVDDRIVGTISYERFGNYGLIRYFVFRKEVDISYIMQLINSVAAKALDKGISSLFSIVNSEDIYALFIELGFSEVEKQRVYVEEENILDTEYQHTRIMQYKLINDQIGPN